MKRRSYNLNKSNGSQGSTDAIESDESHSFTSEDDNQENGDDSSVDVEPREKKRRLKGKKGDSQKSTTPKKRVSKGRKTKETDTEDDENIKDKSDISAENEVPKKSPGKKKLVKDRKSKEKAAEKEDPQDSNVEEDDSGLNDDEEEYEVESIIDEKTIKGIRYYLIRWKGYGEESDTWEPASTLNCPEALQEYKKKKPTSKSSGEKSKKSVGKAKKSSDLQEKWDENEDFEVVRILDVHFKRDGKREFLVAWKGYSHDYDSWEPEENMNCKDMIERFLKKCEQAKEASQKELRVQRKATDRFTLSTNDSGRRLSRRNHGKQRVHYHDAE